MVMVSTVTVGVTRPSKGAGFRLSINESRAIFGLEFLIASPQYYTTTVEGMENNKVCVFFLPGAT